MTEIEFDSFESASVLESVATFTSEIVAEKRFILTEDTIVMMIKERDLSESDTRKLMDTLSMKADWYMINIK